MATTWSQRETVLSGPLLTGRAYRLRTYVRPVRWVLAGIAVLLGLMTLVAWSMMIPAAIGEWRQHGRIGWEWIVLILNQFIPLCISIVLLYMVRWLGRAVHRAPCFNISASGITFYVPPACVHLPWSRFSQIGPVKSYWGSGEGLILSNPIALPPSRNTEGKAITGIPLTRFEPQWRQTELGAAIRQFAPHLFEAA